VAADTAAHTAEYAGFVKKAGARYWKATAPVNHRNQQGPRRSPDIVRASRPHNNSESEGRRRPKDGLDQVDRDLNVAACGLRITAELVGRVEQVLSNLAIDSRQADIETSREGVSVACLAQVHFGVNGYVSRQLDLRFAGLDLNRA
jgi:hypothetical protein